jgi:hypothetical protein
MNMRSKLASALILGVLMATGARAEPPTSVQIEISFLLGYVEGSGCEFLRNGTWSDSKAAQAHLRAKYKYLATRNLIVTTEQFIERAASESSLSGQRYEVKCQGGAAVASSRWLRDELERLRAY